MYQRLADYAAERGAILASDTTVETPAVRVYDALARRGYEVTRDAQAAEVSGDIPALFAPEGRSVFTVRARDGVGQTRTTDNTAPTALPRPARPRQPAGTRAPDLDAAARTDAARATLDAAPDLQITDDDGNVISAADALAAADAELRAAETLAPGAEALASCAIRFIGD